MLRSLVLAFVCTLGAGCSTSREAVVTPPATPAAAVASIVSPPLAGVDSLVVMAVAASFDSTFVAAPAERASEARFLEGRQVQARLDSLLRQSHGAGPLQRAVAGDSTALAEGQRIAVAAARAQAQQDSMQALALLGDAQRLFEEALQHNPHHEDARYQLAELYKIQARQYRDQRRWGTVLQMLRGLLTLNADQHVLWAELATVLDTLRQHEASGLAWMQAASVVLDDANLAFAAEAPAPDSLTLFSYYQRAYSVFVQDRHGAGVREALSLAIDYATDSTQHAYATGEWAWARWDGPNFEHRLAFDSLLTVATHDPQGARQGLATLSPRLGQRSAWLEASYNWAILTWQLQEQDRALDTPAGAVGRDPCGHHHAVRGIPRRTAGRLCQPAVSAGAAAPPGGRVREGLHLPAHGDGAGQPVYRTSLHRSPQAHPQQSPTGPATGTAHRIGLRPPHAGRAAYLPVSDGQPLPEDRRGGAGPCVPDALQGGESLTQFRAENEASLLVFDPECMGRCACTAGAGAAYSSLPQPAVGGGREGAAAVHHPRWRRYRLYVPVGK